MNFSKNITFTVVFGLMGVGVLPFSKAQSAHQSLRKGDRAYDKKEYQAAEHAYRQALAKKPTDAGALYNTGNAAYRQGHYPDAVSLYADAAQRAQQPALKAEALHNLGNAFLQQRQYPKAIEAYENSLRLRPGNPGTKSNLQFAKKKLREQEQQQNPGDKQQQPPPEQDQQPQSGAPDEPEQPQPDEPDQPLSPEQESPEPRPGQPAEQAAEQPAEGRLTPEQARKRLETTVGPADQKSARRYRQNQRPPERPASKKDW